MNNQSEIKYYISAGQECKMYTLRETFTAQVWHGDGATGGYITEVFDFYICNLAVDRKKAAAKAKSIVGKPVKFTVGDLDEITRRKSEEVRAEEARHEKEALERATARNNKFLEEINKGVFPFGMYKGDSFETAADSYLQYWVNRKPEAEEEGFCFARIMNLLSEALKSRFPDLFHGELPEPNDEYFGSVGWRGEIQATLIKSFSFEGYYGQTNVNQFVADSGELLVYMGSAFLEDQNAELQVGCKYSFTAGIKEHSEYKDQKQTKLKIIKKFTRISEEKGFVFRWISDGRFHKKIHFGTLEAFEAEVNKRLNAILEAGNDPKEHEHFQAMLEAFQAAQQKAVAKGQVNLLASQVVKNAGLQSLKQVSDITGISSQTLINWPKSV